MIEAKFEEMLKEQEERSRSQLKELPQILLSKEFASRQEVANEVPKSSMQIKRAENQAARLEKIKIQVEEEVSTVLSTHPLHCYSKIRFFVQRPKECRQN